MKKIISAFIIILIVFSILSVSCLISFAIDEEKTTYNVGDHIEFGNYPQKKVTDEELINQLNSIDSEWISYGYFSGNGENGSMVSSDYMKYRDVIFENNAYRAVQFSAYRPRITSDKPTIENSAQNANCYYTNTIYWFKFEPILWRVLDPKEGLIMSEYSLDSQPYNNYVVSGWGDEEQTYYASNYYYSSIRKWLNDDFYNTAFSIKQKNNIKTTLLENNSHFDSLYDSPKTNDKVFLLSSEDIQNTAYGFPANIKEDAHKLTANGTDYARAQGFDSYKNPGGLSTLW